MKFVDVVFGEPLRAVAIAVLTFGSFVYLKCLNAGGAASICGATAILLASVAVWTREKAVHCPASVKNAQRAASFDWGMHYMRGFAIVCIMLMHVQSKLGYHAFTQAFFSSSTVYFLFISGYLCQYLALRKPIQDRIYYRKKILNVILPYVICSLATAFFVWVTGSERGGIVRPQEVRFPEILKMLIAGKAQVPYWYIPFVTGLFAISPWLTRLRFSSLAWLTGVFAAIAVVFPERRIPGSSTFSVSAVLIHYSFFTVYYLIGFVYARRKDEIDRHLKSWVVPATLLGLVLGFGHLFPGLFGLPILETESRTSFQKLFFLVPVLLVAGSLKRRKIAILDLFAEYSFALFFLHYLFIEDFVALQTRFRPALPAWILDPVLIIAYLAFNLILAMCIKKAFGRWSRSVIGA